MPSDKQGDAMRISVGIDIAKEIHWVTAIDAGGVVQIDRKLLNTPAGIATLVDELTALRGTVRIGLDVIGGIAGLAEAMLADAGFALVHVPGIAVNRARQGTVGGENKTDPRDARTIAEQVRTRSDLRPIEPATELDREIRLLVGRRSDIVQAQTQRLSRMRDLLVGIFPGLEACLDLKTKGPLHLLTKFVTPAELRDAGKKRLVRHLQAAGGVPKVEDIADRVLTVATEQRIAVPAERTTARLIRELAVEALAAARLIALDRQLEACLPATRTRPSSAACPAWGPCSRQNSSPRQATSPASAPPTRSPRRPVWRRCCDSPADPASSDVPVAATRDSSGSSTSPPFAPSPTMTAAPSTNASAAKESDTIKPSSHSPADA
jgi:hypothetical protein